MIKLLSFFLFLFCYFLAFSQVELRYEKEWKIIDSLITNGMHKSALNLIEKLYQKALNDNNEVQKLKAIIKKIDALKFINENIETEAFDILKREINMSFSPYKNIYYSIYAGLLADYFNSNYHRIQKISYSQNEGDDIRTWSPFHILLECSKYYAYSVNNDVVLQKIPISSFKDLLIYSEDNLDYFSTLYDLLISEAIIFFEKFSKYFPEYIQEFSMNNELYFKPSTEFIELSIPSFDTISPQYNVLLLYQKLLRHQKSSNNLELFILWDLKRLKYIYEKSNLSNKEILYKNALTKLLIENEEIPVSQAIVYAIAKYDVDKAKASKSQSENIMAETLFLCEKYLKKFPDGKFSNNLRNIINDITKKELYFNCEKYITSDEYFPVKLNFRNVNKSRVYIGKISKETFTGIISEIYDNRVVGLLVKNSHKIYDTIYNLPQFNDYMTHSTEIILPPFKYGFYLIAVTSDNEFKEDVDVQCYSTFTVTDIAFLKTNYNDSINRVVVLNRKTGLPINNASITLYKNFYGIQKLPQKGKTYYTDKNGVALLLTDNDPFARSHDGYITLEIVNDKDTLVPEENIYPITRQKFLDEKKILASIFTDRSIYRPGQKVQFKAILYDNYNKSVIKNSSLKVTFKDPNFQVIETQELTTNEFGTAYGTFEIPLNILNGNYSLNTEYGSVHFKVEEYKIPKFYIKTETPDREYKLYDTISFKIKAMQYAGTPVQNAIVQYEVYIQPKYIYRWFPFIPKQIKLKDSKTTTNSAGEAIISFIAVPDSSNLKNNSVFNYIIKIKVTDINNETQFAQANINISEVPIFFKSNIDDVILNSKENQLKVLTVNGSENPVSTSITVNIYSLQKTEFLKDRLWDIPDTFIYNITQWKKLLPEWEYRQTFDIKNLKVDRIVESLKSENKKEHVFNLNLKSSGFYMVEYKTLVNNKEITYKEYFIFLNTQEKQVSLNRPLLCLTDKKEYLTGEKIKIYLSSTINIPYFLITASTPIKTYYYYLKPKKDELETINVPLENIKSDGTVIINCICIFNNRIYSEKISVNVKNKEKQLFVEADNVPENIAPGKEINLTIKVTDFNKNPVKSELAISVYDKALDDIYKHDWNFNPYYSYVNEVYFSSLTMFQNQSSYIYINPIKYFDEKNFYSNNVSLYIPKIFFSSRNFPYGVKSKSMIAVLQVEATKIANETSELDNIYADIQIRKNFCETALFLPILKTDEKGYVTVTFRAPETLTTWKILTLAHTSDLKIATNTFEFITQKNVMVTPNLPRYFRQNDTIAIPVKVTNNSNEDISALIGIKINDALNKINYSYENRINIKINKKSSESVSFNYIVPDSLSLLKVTLILRSEEGCDGEEHIIPVLPDVIKIMESFPFYVNSKQTINLQNSDLRSKINKVDEIVFEYVQNPIWYAIMAIPYMVEPNTESTDEIFNVIYISSIAKNLINKIPSFEQILYKWEKDTFYNSLLSELEKNSDLKQLTLKETPWIVESIDEKANKSNLSKYFNQSEIENRLLSYSDKLISLQQSDGGWSWFKGMRSNKYITIGIVYNYLKIKNLLQNTKFDKAISSAINYLDKEAELYYKELKSSLKSDVFSKWQPDYYYLLYIYIKSSLDKKIPEKEYQRYFYEQVKKFWNTYSVYSQALIALACYNYGESSLATQILTSIKERAIITNEKGTYWKELTNGWLWYENAIENTCLIYEAIKKINKDQKMLDDIIKWIILQKQVQMWGTNKASINAIETIVNHFNFSINKDFESNIKIGNYNVDVNKIQKEAGTGYFKLVFEKKNIDSLFYKIQIENKANTQAWGNLYWFYNAKLNDIADYRTKYFSVEKKYYKEVQDKYGINLNEIYDTTTIKPGDIIVTKLIFYCDRDMDFIHIKDMRPANTEPIELISGYKYNIPFSYYAEIKDVSYNIFIDRLPKGKHIIEYKLKAVMEGTCNTGIATIQCYYSPSFVGHSEGKILKIMNK